MLFGEIKEPLASDQMVSTDGADVQSTDPQWAWSPYQPDEHRPWDLRRASHLFRRAAFGATWGQLRQALEDGPQRTVDQLVKPRLDVEAFQHTFDDYEASADGSETADVLRAWWLRRMLETPFPLLEKMTLFWHGHFAIGNSRVKSSRLMRKHVALLRKHALGGFQPLLLAVTRDPATLLGLDCQANRKAQPNENYARGLLETFALGPGNFSETDVSEVARACTGWFVFRNESRFIDREHDHGSKKVLGHEGRFTEEDVVRIILEQPASPTRLVRKLYRWLVSESNEPSHALVQPLVARFAQDYDVGRLVETMLRSNLFFSSAAYRQKIKSPVEFALGIVQGLESLAPTDQLGRELAQLGQDLLHPPTINGWAGGPHWITSITLLGRENLAAEILAGEEPYDDCLNPLAVAQKNGHADFLQAREFLFDLFVQSDLPPQGFANLKQDRPRIAEPAEEDLSARLRRTARSILTLPEFQLN